MLVMARLYEHHNIELIAQHSDVPVINGLTDFYHPCQILGDLLTIKEHVGLGNCNVAFLGDCNNNVAHSMIVAANKLSFGVVMCCPKKIDFLPNSKIVKGLRYTHDKNPKTAVYRSSIIYTDTWMSYHVSKDKEKKRLRTLKPYQVNSKVMSYSKKKPIFMHCLPAKRGHEAN